MAALQGIALIYPSHSASVASGGHGQETPPATSVNADDEQDRRDDLLRLRPLSQQLSQTLPTPPGPLRTATAQAIAGLTTATDAPNNPNSRLKYKKGTKTSSTDKQGDASDRAMAASAAADADVPDGGYGWAAVAGCSTLTFWFGGTTYSWGVMQAALFNRGLANTSTLAFVGSTSVACIAAFALVNARIVRVLGARATGLLGVFLMGMGQIAASFTTHSVGGMFGTQSILMGVGASLCFMVSSVLPAQYFKKRRGLANGIVYAGGGLGGTGIAFLMNAINQRLGIEWTFRVIGLSMLATGMPMAMLLKDRGGPPPIRAWVEWSLFKDYRFTLLFLCGLIATFPLFVPVFFIPLYAESFGIPALGGAGLVAAFQFASFFGRLGGGALADLLGALNTLMLSLVLNAVSMLCIWPFSTSIGPLAIFVVLNGAANGTFFATMPTVVANTFGSARVSVAMGMVVTAWTGGYLLGSPIAGFILGATGSTLDVKSYLPCIFYAGGLSALALVLCLVARFKISRCLAYVV